jgi:photosystem II stability/assembly factor-like uncharacterized protein
MGIQLRKLIFLLTIFLFFSLRAFCQWQWQNPLPQGNDLNDIIYLSESNIIVVGASGTILKSTNLGSTWESIDSKTTSNLNKIFFVNSQKGWIIGNGGTILYSSDEGNSWDKQTSTLSEAYNDVYFTDSFNGWIASSNGINGALLHTTNGGMDWTIQYNNLPHNLTSIVFIDTNQGFAVGDYGLYLRTTNGGDTWSVSSINYSPRSVSINFSDNLNGWIGTLSSALFFTTDGGNSWDYVDLNQFKNGEAISSIRDAKFFDKFNGIVIGKGEDTGNLYANGKIFYTSDSGATWNDVSKSALPVNSVANGGSGKWWISGDNGLIAKTTDNGNSWINFNKGNTAFLLSLSFIDENNGWVSGISGEILRTTNGGQNWNLVNIPSPSRVMDICFINSSIGWISLYSGQIYKTTNGGSSWTEQNNPAHDSNEPLDMIYFIDKDFGWACSGANYGSHIYRTTDGGQSWNWASALYGILDLYFSSKDVGFAVAYHSIYKTTDGGATWNENNPGTNNSIFSLSFIDENNGWAAGQQYIYRTTNAGTTWKDTVLSNINGQIESIFFKDNLHGWFICNSTDKNGSNRVYYTNDGGLNWNVQADNIEKWLKKIFFINQSKGWIVGEGGTILGTDNGGITSVGKIKDKSLPIKFELYQNYPNPFNPSTIISYDIKKPGIVSIKIFDVLGREISTLVNKYQEVGNYKVKFNALNLSNGIYFYRLICGENVQAKKMILLK